jgi:AmiR/NasT family two-component response regulator
LLLAREFSLRRWITAPQIEFSALGAFFRVAGKSPVKTALDLVAAMGGERPGTCVAHEAAKRGVFAYIVDASADELQSAIDITLQRFTEYHSLQGAFGRRALIEQAKGILMARHSIDADRAFEMLRDHSQHNGHKLVDIAQAVVDSHLLLLAPPQQPQAAS